MSDLPQRIEAHLIQCHREDDDSERLLVEAKAEIARLNHEMGVTKEAARAREAILRHENSLLARGNEAMRGELIASGKSATPGWFGAVSDGLADCTDAIQRAVTRAALNGESRE